MTTIIAMAMTKVAAPDTPPISVFSRVKWLLLVFAQIAVPSNSTI